MRSSEEIKKELEIEIAVHFHLPDPEPRLTPREFMYMKQLHSDALAYITQLESRLAQAERERDAAVECIEKAYKTMDRVVHKPAETIQNLREGKKIIYDYCAVKWRSVYEENSKEGETNEGRT